jgi:hypothetical protein
VFSGEATLVKWMILTYVEDLVRYFLRLEYGGLSKRDVPWMHHLPTPSKREYSFLKASKPFTFFASIANAKDSQHATKNRVFFHFTEL